jgi:hypothetical protein
VKLAEVAVAATVTDAATGRTPALLDERPTMEPPVGAAEDNVTLHVVVAPDIMEFGEHTRPETMVVAAGGVTVTEVVALPFRVAVSVTV